MGEIFLKNGGRLNVEINRRKAFESSALHPQAETTAATKKVGKIGRFHEKLTLPFTKARCLVELIDKQSARITLGSFEINLLEISGTVGNSASCQVAKSPNQFMSKPGEIYGRPWSEREYIIVLYYYLLHRNESNYAQNYAQEIAELLGRTPGAVEMRLENYASLDPDVYRAGLKNVGPIGTRVFTDWFNRPDNLRACAEVLIREARTASQPTLFDPEPVRIPKAFGKYELLDSLGDGAFGAVYSCINVENQKRYALKIIKTDSLGDSEIVARFRREIKTLKAMRHPNIIRIHEDNLDDTPHFPAFVMDLANCSLTSHLETKLAGLSTGNQRPLLPCDEAAKILGAVLDGVEALHCHEPPVIHRDIKPDNILQLPTGEWVLADFSLAKFLPRAVVTTTFATASRQAWGTHGYSAPEQFQDFRLANQQADVYSLGVLLWELFSPSWPPFDRTCTLLSPSLEQVVLLATDRNREKRYLNIAEFRKGLNDALGQLTK
jgi:hypothetical protein